MNDQSKTKHVLILEMASLRQGINELKQSESEWRKEKEYQIIKPALLLDLMREANGLISIFDVNIKNTNI
jgi:hypothetical protein